jgi:Anti-sigma-K factor rskA, C-terminal
MSDHEWFEQLCALGVTGDLEPEEFRQLGEHLYECARCRASYQDFHAIIERGLPALKLPRPPRWSLRRFGMKKRFLERARKEGITIEESGPRNQTALRLLAAAVTTGLALIVLGGYGWHVHQLDHDRYAKAADQAATLSSKVSELEQKISERAEPAVKPMPLPDGAPIDKESGKVAELEIDLTQLRRDYDSVVAGRDQLEQRVSELVTESGKLRVQSQASQDELERLRRSLQDAHAALSGTTRDLESMRNARSTDASVLDAQRAQIDRLTATIRQQADVIEHDRELLSAGKDIRDLMAARNLRMVDVQDVGSPGKMRPIPGRIFYTQGKQLIFYAYDLQNRGNLNRVAFQVWGKKEGRSQAPRSLGILYLDDSTQNRWVLKFDDPDVLAQIDQVFVTVEPRGGSQRPTGKQLLTAAFLNDEPNHP